MNKFDNNSKNVSEGLEGAVAGSSEICFIDGKEGKLLYRGYDIDELVEKTSFEEVIYLLWNDYLPQTSQLNELKEKISKYQKLPEELIDLIKLLALKSTPMDTLRTATSMLKSFDIYEDEKISPKFNYERAIRLTASLPVIVAAIDRVRNKLDIIPPKKELSIAANFLYMLKGEEASPLEVRAMDTGLIIHADHEFNASTFATRITTSTLSDMYSSITTGIGTLKGPLHGGANTEVMKMLLEINNVEDVENYIKKTLLNKEKISGFGHRIYKTMDPRAVHLRNLSHQLADELGDRKWIDMTEKSFETVHEETGLWPNVDLFSASVYHVMGINLNLYTAIFAASRVAGWTAHVLEQNDNNRLIRPTSFYTGHASREKIIPLYNR